MKTLMFLLWAVAAVPALTFAADQQKAAHTTITESMKNPPYHPLSCPSSFCLLTSPVQIDPGQTFTLTHTADLTGIDHVNVSIRTTDPGQGTVTVGAWFTNIGPTSTRAGSDWILTGSFVAAYVDENDGGRQDGASFNVYAPWMALTIHNNGTQTITVNHLFVYTPARALLPLLRQQ